jgi:ferredoxin
MVPSAKAGTAAIAARSARKDGDMLRATVDRARCQGAGECIHIAPQSFRMDETVSAVAIDPFGDDESALMEAAQSCPNGAIQLTRDGLEIDVFDSEGSSHG